MKKNRVLITAIIIMLALIAVSGAYVFHRAEIINQGKEAQAGLKEAMSLDQAGETVAEIAGGAGASMIASHVYSHRGSAGANEHSFDAYDDAIAAGSKYIEQDLVISADGVLFVSHDLTAGRLTGNGLTFSSASSEEIESLTTRTGNRILRLSEVFDRYGKDITYVIELKSSDQATINAFEELVDQYDFSDVIIVQSTSTDVLSILEEKFPDMPKLYVCKSQSGFYDSLEMPYVDIISVDIDRGLMTESNCEAAHEHGKMFSAWTLDYESSIREAIRMGVDTYFTNDTPLALSLEREYGLQERGEPADTSDAKG